MQGWLKVVSGAVVLTTMCAGSLTMCHAREVHNAVSIPGSAAAPQNKPETKQTTVTARLSKVSASLRLGLASWYGEVWQGRKTASGEIYDQNLMTACHRSLPFGTLVRVINLKNHRSVVVKINDRGNLSSHRVIDLSSAAAEKIGLLRAGLAPVRLEVVGQAAPQHS